MGFAATSVSRFRRDCTASDGPLSLATRIRKSLSAIRVASTETSVCLAIIIAILYILLSISEFTTHGIQNTENFSLPLLLLLLLLIPSPLLTSLLLTTFFIIC